MNYKYTSSRRIMVGKIAIGGNEPICIQSMINTSLEDIKASVNQIIELHRAGCSLVRFSVPSRKQVDCIQQIKSKLSKESCQVCLSADVHFDAEIALACVPFVDKVRINPGNYAVIKRKRNELYSASEEEREIEKIRNHVRQLATASKEYATAVRIGVNHGSLSSRIINQYGNTVEGMLQSAFEYISFFEHENFHNLVVSLKSSHTNIMYKANMAYVERAIDNNRFYPLHLGVTEAGSSEEGVIKSAVGIGSLLLDGIGDTIRVSLTGDPVNEIPVAQALARLAPQPRQIQTREEGKAILRKSGETKYFSGFSYPLVYNTMLDDTADVHLETRDSGKKFQEHTIQQGQVFAFGLPAEDTLYSVVRYRTDTTETIESVCQTAAELGCMMMNDYAAAYCIETETGKAAHASLLKKIMQASGKRISAPEYISCPTCGRTNYDVEKLLQEIKNATAEMSGLKIAVMGCIVNGPGEMEGADYGFVGFAAGKVNIYVGKEVVKYNVSCEEAAAALMEIIRKQGAVKPLH
jgi:(E)-4-hydroxy-3-methylbut-2-enyl-diphosphate synthase